MILHVRQTTKSLRYGACGAITTFLAGFGAMNAFWYLAPQTESLRGLYSYRSATFGDGIALPLVAFGLMAAYAAVKPSRWRVPAAVSGSILGLLTQISWLIDPAPELNWTLPQPHTFNAAGWYHASFMVAGGFFFGWLLGAVIPNIPRARVQLRAWLTLSIAGAALFILTLVLDNTHIVSNPSSKASLLLATLGGGLAIGTLIALWLPRGRLAHPETD